MRQLLYTSTATAGITERDVRLIVGASQYRNAVDDITGILLFDGQRFLQFVEGPPHAIESLLQRLDRDMRHQDVTVRHDAIGLQRAFPIWSMRWVHMATTIDDRRDTMARTMPISIDPAVRREVDGFTQI